MKHLLVSLRLMLFLTLLTGIVYPLGVSLVAQIAFPKQASGSLIYDETGKLRGSALIAQNFEKPEYFWPRPSAVSFNPLPSGGTNLAPTAKALQEAAKERVEKLRAANPEGGEVPQHLLFTSGSGLDPHQSFEAIDYQVSRVAAARGLPREEVQRLVSSYAKRRQLGFLGEETVNVLELNIALDKMKPVQPAETQEPVVQDE